jgi:3-hydroxy-5-methyl-1-naphthoate 3-O-methyltransferase
LTALLASLGLVEKHDGKWRATAMARTWMHPEAEGYHGPLLGGYYSLVMARKP